MYHCFVQYFQKSKTFHEKKFEMYTKHQACKAIYHDHTLVEDKTICAGHTHTLYWPHTHTVLATHTHSSTCVVHDSSSSENILVANWYLLLFVGWLGGCLTSYHHASVSQGQICSDNCMCCHTETEVGDHTFYLVQSQYTDRTTCPSADPISPDTWQGSHSSANL